MLKLIKKPECSMIFTIPIDLSMQRSIEKNDEHSEPYDFRLRRLSNYVKEIGNNRWDFTIDSTVPIEKVTEQVKEIINQNVKGVRI